MRATFHNIKTPKILKSKITVVIPKDKDNKNIFFDNDDNYLKKSDNDIKRQLAETFYAAAIYGKQRGYSYFAITAKNMNNLNGYPINSFDNIISFCDWEKENSKKNYKPRPICWAKNGSGLFDLYSVKLKVRYFKDTVPGLFFYDINEVIKQTEKYM
jgi:type II secretory pathway pseudopilin PulG